MTTHLIKKGQRFRNKKSRKEVVICNVYNHVREGLLVIYTFVSSKKSAARHKHDFLNKYALRQAGRKNNN